MESSSQFWHNLCCRVLLCCCNRRRQPITYYSSVKYVDTSTKLLRYSIYSFLQLYTNGESIMQAYPSKMIEMLNNVRRVLICNVQLSQTCRLLLLLVLEIANNNFELPEVDICKFYQEQLGDQIMANFHKHVRFIINV